MNIKIFRGLGIAVVCCIISFGGLLTGFWVTQTAQAVTKERFEKLELFNKVLYLIETQYYRQVSAEKLIYGALKGMMETLDPHSAFLDESLFSKMQEDTQGEFGGLGIEVTQKDGVIIVITPIEDSPAFKAGLRPGDKIVEIDHESIMGITLDEAVDKMKGPAKSDIEIGVVRKGVEGIVRYTIKREIIKTKSVKGQLINNEFIYLRLTQFQKRSGESMIKMIKDLKEKLEKSKKPLAGIVLDLRSNPGGLLDEAVEISSIFMKEGVVVSTEGRNQKDKEIRYVKKSGYKDLETPMAILINGASASASEIVAGALQDAKRAIIMGTRSFGKGTVQTVSKIDDTRGVKLTIAQYLTPAGRRIQAIGIVPDVKLYEAEAAWSEEHRQENHFIRESDLRNHLTATVETPEETKVRIAQEKEERINRIEAMKKLREEKERTKKDNDYFYNKDNPAEDYQVNQAMNYLKTFDILNQLKQ